MTRRASDVYKNVKPTTTLKTTLDSLGQTDVPHQVDLPLGFLHFRRQQKQSMYDIVPKYVSQSYIIYF